MTKRPFPLAVVLSAYHNKLMVPFGELRGFLNYMTGHQVALWEIPRARALVVAHLAKQFPWLDDLSPPPGFKTDAGNAGRFIRHVAKNVGSFQLDVAPLAKTAFKPHKPFTEGPWAKRTRKRA